MCRLLRGRRLSNREPRPASGSPSDADADAEGDFGRPILLTSVDLGASKDAPVAEYGAQWQIQTSDTEFSYQLTALRANGVVEQIWLTKKRLDGTDGGPQTVAHLAGDAARRFVDVMRNDTFVNVAGGDPTVVDASVLADVVSTPLALDLAYLTHAKELRDRLRNDATAEDVIAVAHRREVVRKFRQMIEDEVHFTTEKESAGGSEKAWQRLFERNPWLLGASLGAQLFLSWDKDKLEQLVAGWPLNKDGKRVDALLTSAGRIKSAVFAEIKHHRGGATRQGRVPIGLLGAVQGRCRSGRAESRNGLPRYRGLR